MLRFVPRQRALRSSFGFFKVHRQRLSSGRMMATATLMGAGGGTAALGAPALSQGEDGRSVPSESLVWVSRPCELLAHEMMLCAGFEEFQADPAKVALSFANDFGPSISFGSVCGFSAGYAAKKASKVVVVVRTINLFRPHEFLTSFDCTVIWRRIYRIAGLGVGRGHRNSLG